MTVRVEINGDRIGAVEIVNRTGLTDPSSTNAYRWHYEGDGHRALDGELTHRYGDGAMVLAAKVLDQVALRYRTWHDDGSVAWPDWDAK